MSACLLDFCGLITGQCLTCLLNLRETLRVGYWLLVCCHYTDSYWHDIILTFVLTCYFTVMYWLSFTRLLSSPISIPGSHVASHETFCRLHKLKVHHRVHSIPPQDLHLLLVLTRLRLHSQTRRFICWYNYMDWRCFIDRCWEYVLELRGTRQQEVRWGVSPDITRIMRLAGHVARIWGWTLIHIFGRKYRRKDTLIFREENLKPKIDFKELGYDGVEWIHLALNRRYWRAIVNVIINIRVL